MKRIINKSVALLLAVFMTFGVVPFFAVGMVASAEDLGDLTGIVLNYNSLTMVANETKDLSVIASFSKVPLKAIDAKDVIWASNDTSKVLVDSNGKVTALAATTNPVVLSAVYLYNGVSKVATCVVTVSKAPTFVDTIQWTWNVDELLAGTDKVYSYAYTQNTAENLYRVIPDNADDKSATLTCEPASALQIDPVNKTFKVNPITQDSLTITLKLKANGGSPKCLEAVKQIKVYKDVPITGIKWTLAGGSGTSLYSFYESGTKKVNVYRYMPTEAGDPNAAYKIETIPRNDSYLKLLDVKVSSDDTRVITFDEKTGRIIPVGNGDATITVSVKTPKGKVFKDTAKVRVQSSPYTPITTLGKFGYDAKKTSSDAEYDSASNTLTLAYRHYIQLTATLNSGATLDQLDKNPLAVEMDDGSAKTIAKKVERKWTSSDEDVATVDANGKVTITGSGDAVITLTVNDNGKTFKQEINVHGKMPWWAALIAMIMALFSGRWDKIPMYAGAFFGGIFSI